VGKTRQYLLSRCKGGCKGGVLSPARIGFRCSLRPRDEYLWAGSPTPIGYEQAEPAMLSRRSIPAAAAGE